MQAECKYVAKTPDKNGFIKYDKAENDVWQRLYQQQERIVPQRACDLFLKGLNDLNLSREYVPQCNEVSNTLNALTGWGVTPVPALIEQHEFFELLANKQFPAASFIRRPEEFEYLEEPDIFHEIYGHCPLLTVPAYADFMQAYGALAIKATADEQEALARLYWFTIEFGLIKDKGDMRIYGAGILSSCDETVHCLENPAVVRKPLNALDALRTPYRINIQQPLYYYIESFEELYSMLDQDLIALVHEAKKLGDFTPHFIEEKQHQPHSAC